jgi:hypothetical protein
MMRLIVGSLFLIAMLTATAAAQGAHYEYPFSLECPDGIVTAGDEFSVSVKFEGGYTGDRYRPTYYWTTSAGYIVSGQGTTKVTVAIPKEQLANVELSLNRTFQEAHFPGVQGTASCVIAVAPRPLPRLVEEFRTRGDDCEYGFALLDRFFVELSNDPTATGMIVLYGDTRDRQAASRRELQLRNHFIFRKFPRDRVTFVRGVAKENGTTQFWLIPAGAEAPEVASSSVPTGFSPSKAPYFYAANYLDGVPGCVGHIYDLDEYASELKSRQGSMARIVISESSRRKFNLKLAEIIAALKQAGIPRSRITAAYKYVRPNRMLEVVELWIRP